MQCKSLIAVLAALILHGCGLASHGGIVDNGNKPTNPGTTAPMGPSQPTVSVPVMSRYQVSVPKQWPVDAALESNILKFNGHAILFVEGSGICDVQPTLNEFDVKIYACAPTLTIYDVGDGDFVVAKHPARNAEMDQVLYSLRRN